MNILLEMSFLHLSTKCQETVLVKICTEGPLISDEKSLKNALETCIHCNNFSESIDDALFLYSLELEMA